MPPAIGVVRAVASLAGAALGLRLASRTTGWVGPLQIAAEVHLDAAGGVDADLPPLGRAHLRTHRGPLAVRAQAIGVDPERAQGLLDVASDDAGRRDIKAQLDAALTTVGADAKRLGFALAVRSTVAALAGAAGAAALVRRRPADAVAGAALGALALASAAGVAAVGAERAAWRDPQLTGLLTKAPLILGDLQKAPERLGTYRDQLAELVATATSVYERVVDLPEAPPADAIKLVHISDVHLSPLAHPLAKALVEQYGAHAVIDTGDLVDWGTPAEDALAGSAGGLGVPYVYIKGNHDSEGTAKAVARQANATVFGLDSEPQEVAGLIFAGMPDPRFTPDKTTGDDHAHHRVGPAGQVFADHIRGKGVDIALVHSPAAGRPLAGLVPLVLAGDIHRREVQVHGDTTILVQGTSGGAGLRGVQADPPTPISLSVLYLDRTTKRLWGVDEVTLGGIGTREIAVVRRTAAELVAGA